MLIPIRVSMNFYHFELACLFVCRLAKHRVRSYRRPFVLIAALTNFFFDNSLDRRMTTQCTTTDQRHHVKNLNLHSITSKLAQSVCQNGVIFVPDITSDAIGLWKKKVAGRMPNTAAMLSPHFWWWSPLLGDRAKQRAFFFFASTDGALCFPWLCFQKVLPLLLLLRRKLSCGCASGLRCMGLQAGRANKG